MDTQLAQEPKKQFKQSQPILHPLKGSQEEINAFNFAISQDNFIYAITFIMIVGYLCSVLRSNTIQVKYKGNSKSFT